MNRFRIRFIRPAMLAAMVSVSALLQCVHAQGHEFRKHKQSAQDRGIDRKTFIDEHNNPNHYRPELPSSNRSHKGEDLTDNYLGD